MKILVDLMPERPIDCLFCIDAYKDLCQFYNETCWLSDRANTNKTCCPYLKEVKDIIE